MAPCPLPRSSVAAWPLQPSAPPPAPPATALRAAPPPAPPATALRAAPPPRRWRSSPGPPSCQRGSPAPGRAWAGQDQRGTRRGSPPCSRPRAASALPPAPARSTSEIARAARTGFSAWTEILAVVRQHQATKTAKIPSSTPA
eukprot:scaffold92902_cov66-Phaeocystis_antarctica.AAC.3